MTAKEFFKGTAFKCIVVLLSIVLICGVLLTFANALFAVSDQERLDRAIADIYGEQVEYTAAEVDEKYADTAAYTINSVYVLQGEHEGEYLVSSTGKGGYQNGTVTNWVVLEIRDGVSVVTKISLSSNEGQSYIYQITDSVLNEYISQSERDDFEGYSSSLITGATVQGTLAAVTNSLNGAKTYVDSVYCGLVQPFDGYEYLDYINRNSTTVEVSGTDVTYNIVTNSNGFAGSFEIQITVGADGAISAYTIVTNGSTNGYGSNMAEIANNMVGETQDSLETFFNSDDLHTGATLSNTLCVQAGLFATANHDRALADYS